MTVKTIEHELDDRVAVVTGSTSGIGRAIAERLATLGASVVVHGRDPARGAEVVNAIVGAGGRARFLSADLTDPPGVSGFAEAAGDVDVLVDNAGFSWFGPTPELDPGTLDRLFAANVQGAYLLTAAMLPRMVGRGGGVVVNVGSMAGAIGLPGGAAYGASKAALASLTRSWAAEYGRHGIRVNTVSPGPVHTPGALTERTTALGETTSLGRAADPSEIAEVVGFLASPRPSYVLAPTSPSMRAEPQSDIQRVAVEACGICHTDASC